VRLPYNRADGERAVLDPAPWADAFGRKTPHQLPKALDYTSKGPKDPVLSTSILRYRRLGGMGAVTLTTVTIEDPTTGRRIELAWTPYGTSYRGARQHWRLFSPGYAETGAIGDFYDDAPGPFHAP
jgi:hypothetical protein